MKKYRLKKDAVKFFLATHSASIYELEKWNSLGVDIIALDEVEDVYIEYGHYTSKSSKTISGWNDKGSHFHFTIVFPSVKHLEHDIFTKGKLTRELMDEIQYKINDFYERFIADPDKEEDLEQQNKLKP